MMIRHRKRIINGKTYNTQTATLIADHKLSDKFEDEYERLFQTRHGAFFLQQCFRVRVGDYEDDEPVNMLEPLSPIEAQEWLEKHYFDEEVFQIFGDPSEAGCDESRITLRIPDSLKVRIERLAAADKQSLNTWIMRCLEVGASPRTTSH